MSPSFKYLLDLIQLITNSTGMVMKHEVDLKSTDPCHNMNFRETSARHYKLIFTQEMFGTRSSTKSKFIESNCFQNLS